MRLAKNEAELILRILESVLEEVEWSTAMLPPDITRDDVERAVEAQKEMVMLVKLIEPISTPFYARLPEQAQRSNSCNRHKDCDAAEAKERESGYEPGANFHCHDDCCEDCFGS